MSIVVDKVYSTDSSPYITSGPFMCTVSNTKIFFIRDKDFPSIRIVTCIESHTRGSFNVKDILFVPSPLTIIASSIFH